jgi:3-hydroxyisobutyrate dehydrogenase
MGNVSGEAPAHGPVGFVGLGVMGQPMALNLARVGIDLVVWNRSPARTEPLRAAGARVADTVDEVFGTARTVFVMLRNDTVTDAVLRRGTPSFAELVNGRLVVSMGSAAPAYSQGLAADISAADGRDVEAPVSGSRKPAEAGQLVAMVGGDEAAAAEIRPLLTPMCREILHAGPVGSGLRLKLAVNLYLDTMLAALTEAFHFAQCSGLDLATFEAAIEAGPMASDLTRTKLPMLRARDFTVQAAAADAHANTRLIADAAREVGMASPLLDLSSSLYAETVALGNGRRDMASVLEAIEARTQAQAQAQARERSADG